MLDKELKFQEEYEKFVLLYQKIESKRFKEEYDLKQKLRREFEENII